MSFFSVQHYPNFILAEKAFKPFHHDTPIKPFPADCRFPLFAEHGLQKAFEQRTCRPKRTDPRGATRSGFHFENRLPSESAGSSAKNNPLGSHPTRPNRAYRRDHSPNHLRQYHIDEG